MTGASGSGSAHAGPLEAGGTPQAEVLPLLEKLTPGRAKRIGKPGEGSEGGVDLPRFDLLEVPPMHSGAACRFLHRHALSRAQLSHVCGEPLAESAFRRRHPGRLGAAPVAEHATCGVALCSP